MIIKGVLPMYVIAVLGERKDLGFAGFLKKVFEARGIRAECVFAKVSTEELKRRLFAKEPDILILFSDGAFPVLRGIPLAADIFIPFKRNFHINHPVKRNGFVILSSDDKKIFPFFLSKGLSLITCGYSSKASITISGMDKDEGKIQCCVQREIVSLKGEIFEPQEFSVERDKKAEVDRILIAAGVLIVTGDLTVNMTSKN